MPRRGCHVAVVGAGAIGLAVALQLRRAGVPEVAVIERNVSPGMGSTSRANGGVRAQFTTPINIAFSRYTIAGLLELDRITSGLLGLRQVGYLFMVGTQLGSETLRRGYEIQRESGVDVHWLTADDVMRLAPFVRPDELVAGTFCPSDGIIDPGGLVSALFAEARRIGVEFFFGETLIGIDRSTHPIRLTTSARELEADFVVNAAGPFAREVAAMGRVDIPVVPYRRNLACTEAVRGYPERIPMCVDVDTGVLVRREGAGFLLAYSDPADTPSSDTTFDPRFLEALANRVGHRFPFLEAVAIDQRKCWAGLYPETPDHHAIVDGSPGDARFIHCAGFGGHGIMHSLAAGQAVTELIKDGHCATFDLEPLQLERFQAGRLRVETAVL